METESLGKEIWDVIRGQPRSYTEGSLKRAALLLAIPMVIEMLMQSAFSIADVYFVGKVGSDAQAVVGLTDSLLAIVFAVAIGLSMGAAAMVARRIGEGDPERAARAAFQAIVVGVLFSILSGIGGVLGAEWLLNLLGNDAGLARYGRGFAAIMLGGNITVTLLFLINAIFRGAGQPTKSMWALMIANGLNIALDPILIFGWGPIPAMGLEGAAIATTLSRGIGVAYQFWALRSANSTIRITRSAMSLRPATMVRLVQISAIGILQFLISTTSFIGVFEILSGFGAKVLAGYTVAVRIIIFILLPVWGMGNAAATLVGQNLGANKPDRAEAAVWMVARWNAGILFVVTLIFFMAGSYLVMPFSADPEVLAIAARCLKIVALSYVFWGFGMATVLAFNGAGDTTTPTWINFIAYWLVQLPFAYWAANHSAWGESGVFAAITIAQALLAGLGIVLFRSGKWKSRQI